MRSEVGLTREVSEWEYENAPWWVCPGWGEERQLVGLEGNLRDEGGIPLSFLPLFQATFGL